MRVKNELRRSIIGSVRRETPRTVVAFALVFAATASHADTQNGSLGTAAAATDYYQVICSNDGTGPPASLSIQVSDEAPVAAPLVSVQVRNGSDLLTSTDPTDGDGTASPLIHMNVRSGTVFDVLVDKTGSGSESYVLTFHCKTGPDGTGLHTGTGIVTRQNQ